MLSSNIADTVSWWANTAMIWRLQIKSTRLRSPGCCMSDHTCHGILKRFSQAKRTRRQFEDLWRKCGLTVHHQMFTVQRQVVKGLILNSINASSSSLPLEKLHALVLSSVSWKSCYTLRSRLRSQNTLRHTEHLPTASAISSTRRL